MCKYRTLGSEFVRITCSEPSGKAKRAAISRGDWTQAHFHARIEASCKVGEEQQKGSTYPGLPSKQMKAFTNNLFKVK